MERPVQFFSDEYLEQCKAMSPEQIVKFLDDYRKIATAATSHSNERRKAISIRIPENLLHAFKTKCLLQGESYQKRIVKQMRQWLLASTRQ